MGLIFYLLINTGVEPGTKQSLLDKIENGNAFASLLWGTFAATICTILFYLIQWFHKDGSFAFPSIKYFGSAICAKESVKTKEDHDEDNSDDEDDDNRGAKPLLSFPIAIDSFLHGMARIFPALIVLNLAWAVGAIMQDVGADRLFSRWIVGGIDPQVLPTLSFLISFIMALATGTSWGTMAILFPLLLVPTYDASNGDELIFYATVAGVLSGSVAGDHVSPISDTTVLSALACDCQLLRHVATQSPYVAAVVILSTFIGTIPIGFDVWHNIISILLGLVIVILYSYFFCVPIESPTGRYDIVTELILKITRNQELLDLKENTKKYYAGEVFHDAGSKEELIESDDVESVDDKPKAVSSEEEPLKISDEDESVDA